eukprot:CAMPEP_0175128274 /NCGR_PEP_ID=MMETSP0087-20121206/4841_1 /TAXON_ID=136419 /ORGANISM="Unknown Unknown, Strain D1" /LENGTH=266 /DNA_ID=CAMNT_0016410325 /DNA_START=27 /DNA_END=824 /DNA_ORIENTATION=+
MHSTIGKKVAASQKKLTFDSIKFEQCIGEGSFGKVYKGVCGSQVLAIKVLKNTQSLESKLEFFQEVKLLNQLQHPNILALSAVFIRGTSLYIVSPFMEQGTLNALLQDRSRALTWPQKIKLALDVATGLSYLHQNNIIHRDLKSENVLLHGDRACVADFGLARPNFSSHLRLKRQMSNKGTWFVMPPEMYNDMPYDSSCDVFAFGILLCELMTRCTPGDLPRSDDFGVAFNEIEEEGMFCPGCPAGLVQLARQCCAVDKEHRPLGG